MPWTHRHTRVLIVSLCLWPHWPSPGWTCPTVVPPVCGNPCSSFPTRRAGVGTKWSQDKPKLQCSWVSRRGASWDSKSL